MQSRSGRARFYWFVSLLPLALIPCGLAQSTGGIFITPVPNAPFTGVIVVQRTRVASNNGSAMDLKTVREVARDSQGRIYNVFRSLEPASESSTPPVERIHFYDPQSRGYTYLYPEQKTYTTGIVNHPPAANPADLIASPTGSSVPLNQFTKQEDLGTNSIGGVSAHGVRETQTLPAASSGTGSELVLTDEYWYSDDLHMNVEVKHNDPRTGSVTMTLTQVARTEPDASLFQIPDGYQRVGLGSEQMGLGSGSPQQPSQETPAPTSELLSHTYHIGGPVSAPRLVTAPDPVFPSEQREGGVVVVACLVDDKGLPQQVHVVRSLSGEFDSNAIQAVEQYRFEPAMLQGESGAKPVAVEVNIEVNFRSR
jgi:TonB family protein